MKVFLNTLLLAATNGDAYAASSSSNLGYFLAAYLLLWTVIFGYLLYLHRYMGQLEKKIDEEAGEQPVTPGEDLETEASMDDRETG